MERNVRPPRRQLFLPEVKLAQCVEGGAQREGRSLAKSMGSGASLPRSRPPSPALSLAEMLNLSELLVSYR